MIQNLPVDSLIPEIKEKISENQSIVITSPPGSGKTTRVPPALCELFPKKILVLQPRRIAVRRSAQRIADERGWKVGKEVGYQIRFEKRVSAENRLVVITEGILANKIQGDPLLQDVSCIVLDEFHERSIHTDFAVSWIKELQRSKRKDLKLVVMSATMEAKEISYYLDNAPVLESEAKPFSLEIVHGERPVTYHSPREFYPTLVSLIESALRNHEKDILVFLPGAGEIRKTIGFLKKKDVTANILPLYSNLSQEEQERALKKGQRKRVVLATNIAESSLTVEGVGVVIDSGMEKVLTFDPLTGAESLDLKRISKASTDQRAGRAAREGEGFCYRMWTTDEEDRFLPFLAPEIFRIDLSDHLLYLKALGIHDPLKWGWLSYPLEIQVRHAVRALLLLRAITKIGNVTDFGKAMALIPAGCRLSALLLYGKAWGNVNDAALTAALLMERDFLKKVPRDSSFDSSDCDIRMRKDIFQDVKYWSEQEVDKGAVFAIQKTRDYFLRITNTLSPKAVTHIPPGKYDPDKILLLIFADRLTRRRVAHITRVKVPFF